MQTTSRHYQARLCCKKLGTSHDVKGFAIGSFLECIVNERANDDLCYKSVKNAALIRAKPIKTLYLTKIFPENNHKIGRFYRLIFGGVCPENSHEIAAKSGNFSVNLPLKIPRNLTFFHYLSEAQHSMARSIRYQISCSRYKLGGKLALFMRFGTFFMMKAKQDKMKCLF